MSRIADHAQAGKQAEALTRAAEAAGHAPSIHNTQPWLWRVRAEALELWSVRDRQLRATDREGRMLTISCGAALHHACVALAAGGYAVTVEREPDITEPDHLATVRVGEQTAVRPEAMRRYQAITVRHTDRRPVTDDPVPTDSILTISDAVAECGGRLHILHHDQILQLAAAASFAQNAEGQDEGFRAELAYWTGAQHPDGAGVPDDAIPARTPLTLVPGRDFGHHGSMPVSAGHDSAATYALLYTDADGPTDWLVAGEAMSAGWLAATQLGVSVLPLSASVEVAGTRQTLRQMLFGLGFPQLVVRLGTADPQERGPRPTPRLASTDIIEA